jgi:hypothetical protein
MDGNEIRPRNAITIKDYAISSAAGTNCSIANFGQTEASVLLPHMPDRDVGLRRSALDHGVRRRTGPVVGHDHFEGAISLARERA